MPLTKDELRGLYTAIVTPFHDDKSVDFTTLTTLVRFQLDSGASGIVPIGGTGEYPALSAAERADIVCACVDAADGAPVLPGVLATGFADAVAAGKDFAAAGASAVMLITPYYAPGTQDGMRAYFRNARDAVGIPLLAYDIPRRTGVGLEPETIAALAEDQTIIGMKSSSLDMPAFLKTIRLASGKLAVLSGEEPLFAVHVAAGARGGVLASASIYPRHWIKVFGLASAGKLQEALTAYDELAPFIEVVFRETNPGPLKHYMKLAGRPAGGIRLPLSEPGSETVAALEAVHADMAKLQMA